MILLKPLLTEEYQYYSEQSLGELRAAIHKVLQEPGDSVNLCGRFVANYAFKMTPKRQTMTIRNYEREESFLEGQIFEEQRRTRVTFKVRPNSVFIILFFGFPLFSVIPFTLSRSVENDHMTLFMGLIFAVVVPIIMLVTGHFSKQRIKNEFVSTFHLLPLETNQTSN